MRSACNYVIYVTNPPGRQILGMMAHAVRPWLLLLLAGSVLSSAERTLHRDAVLGTSLDCVAIGPSEAAADRALAAIETRFTELDAVFSTWRDDSALARLNADSRRNVPLDTVPAELVTVLEDALRWYDDSGGIFDPCHATPHGESAPYRIRAGYLRHDAAIDLSAIAKGFIIDQAASAARAAAPDLTGLLINSGGDLICWGRPTLGESWPVSVTDPRQPADNASPLQTLQLADQAIATSGSYHRPGHLTDTRAQQAAVAQASVIAADAATADALATICALANPRTSLRIIERTPGAAALIVMADGGRHQSSAWPADPETAAADASPSAPPPAKALPWYETHTVEVSFNLVDSTPDAGKFHRHFVAAWVSTPDDQFVALLALWAKSDKDIKYVRDLKTFWNRHWSPQFGREFESLRSRTKATRKPGAYSLVWDGRSENGEVVPKGNYVIHIEVNREKGPPNKKEQPTAAAVPIAVGGDDCQNQAADQPELSEVRVRYGPR